MSDLHWAALIATYELGGDEALTALLHASMSATFAMGGREALDAFARSLTLWDGERTSAGERNVPSAVRSLVQRSLTSWIQTELNERRQRATQGVLDACNWHSLRSEEQRRFLEVAQKQSAHAAETFLREMGPLGLGYTGITREG